MRRTPPDLSGPLVVPVAVIVETSWLVERRLGAGAEATFLRAATSELEPADLSRADWQRAAELVEQYQDLGLGIVDASVVVVAEGIGAVAVATLDHRHFTVVRPRHVEAFTLVP